MWAAFKRIIKPRGAIVLTASQPFTSALVMSNPKWFRYAWVWDKIRPSGFQYANYRPMMQHEDILVFGTGTVNYYPQKVKREKPVRYRGYGKSESNPIGERDGIVRWSNEISPMTILAYVEPRSELQHPTQKPVDLFRYLIRTYTRPGEIVFDPVCGSGTTAVAAREEGRRYIVGDSSAEYVQVARDRLALPFTPSFLPALDAASA